MSSKRVAARVVLSFIFLSIAPSAPPHSSDTAAFAATGSSYRLAGGAKVVRVAYPPDWDRPDAAPAEHFAAGEAERRTVRIARGQTLVDILLAAGVDRAEAARAAAALAGLVDLRSLQVGRRMSLYLVPEPHPAIANTLLGLALEMGGERDAVIFRDFDRGFSARRMDHQAAVQLLDSIIDVGDAGKAGVVTRDLVLREGQNLNRLLIDSGATPADGHAAASKLGERVDLRRLQIGQTLTATYETFADGRPPRLAGIAMTLPGGRVEVVGRDAADRWRHGPAALAGASAGAQGDAPADEDRPVVVAHAERTPPSANTETVTVVLERGDILFDRLIEAGVGGEDAERAVDDLAKVLDLRKLRIGEAFRLSFSTPDDGGQAQLTGLSATLGEQVVVLGWPLVGSGSAAVAEAKAPSVKHVAPVDKERAEGEIEAADADDGDAEGVPLADAPGAHDARLLSVERGDNLSALLDEAGASRGDVVRVLTALRRIYNPNRLQVGQRLVVELDRADAPAHVERLTLETGERSAVTVERTAPGSYRAQKEGRAALEAAVAFAQARARAHAAAAADAAAHGAGTGDPESLEARVNGYRRLVLDGGARRIVTLPRGGTLMEVLVEAGSNPPEAHAAIESVRELYNPRRLKAGQEVALTFIAAPAQVSLFATPVHTAGDGSPVLGGISLEVSADKRLEVVRLEDGNFASGFVAKDLVSDHRRVEGTIETSLYDAAKNAGVPVAVLMELIRIYSFDVDFQRDIQPGDSFELLYEMLVDEFGTPVKSGAILFAALELSGTVKEMYRYRLADGTFEYFDARGESVRKALLRTPVDGARLSSGFGMRRHPILGYSKMHKGIDFAAPRGTPVYAAGDGVIERASRYGAYGNYVRVRHNGEYATAYAHLNGFAEGIYPGKRISQGQTIGYVGSTGRSTGPHLHYEVLRHDGQVNPLSVELPTGIKLSDAERARFLAERDRLRSLYAELPATREVAANRR